MRYKSENYSLSIYLLLVSGIRAFFSFFGVWFSTLGFFGIFCGFFLIGFGLFGVILGLLWFALVQGIFIRGRGIFICGGIRFGFFRCLFNFRIFRCSSGFCGFEFLVRFVQFGFDQTDDEFFLAQSAVVDLLVTGDVVMPCFSSSSRIFWCRSFGMLTVNLLMGTLLSLLARQSYHKGWGIAIHKNQR